MGRLGYFVNSISVVGIGSCLFYIIYNNLFEYHYAWEHSSRTLPVYYIISSFWEGQEGSFWLWGFWQAVLGNILIWRAKSWEKPVLAIIALSQTLLASMLLGVEVLGSRIGSSPFILLRQAMEGAPIFSQPNYMTFVKDGNGLNPRAAKLLDGDPSANVIPWLRFNGCAICVCRCRFMAKTV